MPAEAIEWNTLPWGDLIPRLLWYAARRIRRVPRASSSTSPEDLVFAAVEKTIGGARRWDPMKVGLLQHLIGVINSDLYNSVRKDALLVREGVTEEMLSTLASNEPDPESQAIVASELKQLFEHVHKHDPMLSEILGLWLVYGIESPAEQAEALRLPISDVRNLRKRMNRSLAKYLETTVQ